MSKFKLDEVICVDCRFYSQLGKKEDDRGYCNYNPPTIIATRQLLDDQDEWGVDVDALYRATVSPVVWAEGSCGKWEKK